MNDLPVHNHLPIDRLSSVFNDTTNSYKFYWFLSILDEIVETNESKISYNKLTQRMISKVWYPLNYFRLSFGKSDNFQKISNYISEVLEIDNSVGSKDIFEQLKDITAEENKILFKIIADLMRWVPYRFIRPFMHEETRGLRDTQVNSIIKTVAFQYARSKKSKCIYYFSDQSIIINDAWREYFTKHVFVLRSFTYWHLCKFLQKNNPNVIGLSEKLFKPKERNLNKKVIGWKTYLRLKPNYRCIYSGDQLTKDISLDHFIPWSYVVHDQNWNLVPTSKSLNCKKSDNLPSFSHYLKGFCEIQYDFFLTLHSSKGFNEIIEEYCILFGMDVRTIAQFSVNEFSTRLTKTLQPQLQNAENIGFKAGWIYS